VTPCRQTRWLLSEQAENSVSRAMLLVVILWLGILFLSIGLFAPPNATVVAALMLSALSVSGAIFLILELDLPYGGLISISSQPMRLALEHLGK
jgi:polyferredoxin